MRMFAVAMAVALVAAGAPGAGAEEFGPRIIIEKIEITGNSSTADRVILRALPVAAGDELRGGDRRLREARYKLLALGFFRDVGLSLAKGSQRGYVILRVEVEERGTIVLNNFYFGVSEAVPWWLGAEVSDANFLGTGVQVGVGAVHAADSEIYGGQDQWSYRARIANPALFGSPLGVAAELTMLRASEPYLVAEAPGDGAPEDFQAFSYERRTARLGISYDLTPLSSLGVSWRLDAVSADAPPDGARVLAGDSLVNGLSVAFEHDTRPDPILPFTGSRLSISAEVGAGVWASDYDFGSALARYERWWPVLGQEHVVSLHLTGGVILGDAPLFDRFYVGDINRLLAPRAQGLVVSTQPAPDFLGTGADEVTYGDTVGLLEVEYTYLLFRRRQWVYGGRLYVGAGLVTLVAHDSADDPPLDVVMDAGIRLDTEFGIFELTLGNGLGRMPL